EAVGDLGQAGLQVHLHLHEVHHAVVVVEVALYHALAGDGVVHGADGDPGQGDRGVVLAEHHHVLGVQVVGAAAQLLGGLLQQLLAGGLGGRAHSAAGGDGLAGAGRAEVGGVGAGVGGVDGHV